MSEMSHTEHGVAARHCSGVATEGGLSQERNCEELGIGGSTKAATEEGLWPSREMLRFLGSQDSSELHRTCDTLVMPTPVTTVTIPHRSAPPSLYLDHPSSALPPQLFLFLQPWAPPGRYLRAPYPDWCLCQGV